MKILVFGAGNIGSLYAANLKEAGHEVTILARGRRLHDIREHGILLQNFRGGRRTTTRVHVVGRLDPGDCFDFVLVVLPQHRVREVLPGLAENCNVPGFMFFGNSAAGADEMIKALGQERVMLGFPGAAGVRHGATIRYLILDRREQPTTIGELDGSDSPRIRAIASALQSAGFPTAICSNMDAWLKTHVAEISPTVNALYMAGGDIRQLQGNHEALMLMIRAIREGHRVLSELGVPITPSSHRMFRWIPESILAAIARRKLGDNASSVKIGHAVAARDEMKTLADEFHQLVLRSRVDTPAIDQLRSCFNNSSPVEGNESIRSGASTQQACEVESAT